MKIAIVGAGISGLTAAYLLNREHEIALYEQADYAGGHAHTVSIDAGDREVAVDTGFLVYNERTYPGFTKLLRSLGVRTKASDMSLSVRCRACNIEYSSRGIGGFLAQRSNLLRPARASLLMDILRFYRDTRRAIDSTAVARLTVAEYMEERRYGGEFRRHFLLPLAAAVWSMPQKDVGRFPAQYLLRFLHNHGIIGMQPAYEWRTIAGGSRRYVAAMTEHFADRVRLGQPVRGVRRGGGGVTVFTGEGEEAFDQVVIATHADQALTLLMDASSQERDALSKFRYTSNRAVLHTDGSVLPRKGAVRASWNYLTEDCRASDGPPGMTYHLNRLQALDEPVNYCVTLNGDGIRPDTIVEEMVYEHPWYGFETLKAQQLVESLQGERSTFFAGAHLGYGFHEDGLQSGVRVARRFGIEL